jgi:hypothetical protein
MLHQEAVLAMHRQEVLRLHVAQHLLKLTLQQQQQRQQNKRELSRKVAGGADTCTPSS